MIQIIGGVVQAKWLGFNEGLALVKKIGKPMMVDFYTDWCHWCKVMDEETFENKQVKTFLDRYFIMVRILAEDKQAFINYKGKKLNNVEFTRALGINGFPSLLFLDKSGEPITILPGFIPAEHFLPILKYIHQECYRKQMSFKDFLKKQEECE